MDFGPLVLGKLLEQSNKDRGQGKDVHEVLLRPGFDNNLSLELVLVHRPK